MRSVRSRRSESSAARRTVSRDRPRTPSRAPTFVATTTSSRTPRDASQDPRISSDAPGPFGPWEPYTSAVSTKSPPAAAYASRTACEPASSAVHPNTFPPRQSGKTSRSVALMRGMGPPGELSGAT
jgi:hypothetical protein